MTALFELGELPSAPPPHTAAAAAAASVATARSTLGCPTQRRAAAAPSPGAAHTGPALRPPSHRHSPRFACRAAQRLFTNFCISSMESS